MFDLDPSQIGPVRALLTQLVQRRVDQILSQAVGYCRAQTLDPQMALVMIAQITGLRNLEADLSSRKPLP